MGEFRDSLSKQIIRKKWCKPLLEFLHQNLHYKFIYLGLPGPEALDLYEWIDYIEQVIAFQCRNYRSPSNINQSRKKVEELEEELMQLERVGRLGSFSIYDGYIEEVVLRGRDIIGNLFSQNDIVTIYNLDFCNEITSPLKFPDDKGNIHKYYKFQTVQKLLEIQRDITSKSRIKKFIIFLTINSHFWDPEAENFIRTTESEKLKKYISRVRRLKSPEKELRLLKSYIFDKVRNYFIYCKFTPEFLPVIYYKGSGTEWLLHFAIMGAYNEGISGAPNIQQSEDYLYQSFLGIKEEEINPFEFKGSTFAEADSATNAVDIFCRSDCYKALWCNHGDRR